MVGLSVVSACERRAEPPAASPTPTATATAIRGPSPTATAAPPNVLTLRRPKGPEWFGLYLVGKKAGFTRSEVRLERRGGAEVLVARQEVEITATLGGNAVRRVQRDEKIYEARPGGRLLAFTSERSGDGGDRSVRGDCTPAGCALVLRSEAGREERRIPDPGETAEQADAARLAAALRAPVRGPQLQGEPLRVRQVEDLFRERRKLGGAGVEVEVSVVAEQEVGDRAALEVSIADDGTIVEMRLGDSLVARAEPEEVARRLDRVDLFNLTRVLLPGPLPREVPGAIAYRLRGLPAAFQQGDERQAFAPAPEGETLLTVTARQPRAADPARDTPRSRKVPRGDETVLGPSAESVGQVDSDAPAIRALAARVVGDVPGAYAAAQRLLDHVNRTLRKTFGQSRDRASEVLAAGQGDCTEHALLFVALARAAGVPARLAYGLVYTRYGDAADALYWHAWAEVRSGGEWIAMDPTFGQPVADATHVLLGRGAQVDAMGLLGSLRVASAGPVALPASGAR